MGSTTHERNGSTITLTIEAAARLAEKENISFVQWLINDSETHYGRNDYLFLHVRLTDYLLLHFADALAGSNYSLQFDSTRTLFKEMMLYHFLWNSNELARIKWMRDRKTTIERMDLRSTCACYANILLDKEIQRDHDKARNFYASS